jgi:hypothetical protein
MARKLLIMVALVGLVSLIQAPPGSAGTYPLYGGTADDYVSAGWTEVHGPNPLYVEGGSPESVPNSVPGYVNGSFRAYDYVTYGYNIPLLVNPSAGTSTSNGDWVTVQIVYNTRDYIDPSNPSFSASGYGGPDINSFDTVITTTATYKADANGQPLYAYDATDQYYHYTLQNGTMTMTGYGTNSSDNGTYFTLSGTMVEMKKNTQHIGYFSDLSLTYPAEAADPSAVPIPGAVWLLGTGLLGLGCVGRRRKS